MTEVCFPYGKKKMDYSFQDNELEAVLTSQLHDFRSEKSQEEIVREAMAEPVGSRRLRDLAEGKKRIVIIASDHTRPVPSRIIMPLMLEEIRSKNPDADVTILIATGCHRGTVRKELEDKFGAEIAAREKIVVHDCDAGEELISIGKLPSGGDCVVNRLAAQADLLVAEGFIEPHFFAGYSGGRKSVLPGIAGRETVLGNHCSEFIADPNARMGQLEKNPIHEDMLWAAKKAKLAYIVNVVIDSEKKIIYAVSGDVEAAHRQGREFLASLCEVRAKRTDVVVTTNGGYPLDQNVYQAVKGMTAAEAAVRKGGVIIMLAEASDGIGGEAFYRQLAEEEDLNRTMELFLARARTETQPDQWQTQILIRILLHAHVILLSEIPEEQVRKMHMIPAHSIEEALRLSRELLHQDRVSITAIPDGVSVIVKNPESK